MVPGGRYEARSVQYIVGCMPAAGRLQNAGAGGFPCFRSHVCTANADNDLHGAVRWRDNRLFFLSNGRNRRDGYAGDKRCYNYNTAGNVFYSALANSAAGNYTADCETD